MRTIKIKGILQTIPCGKCEFCHGKKRKEWSYRLEQEFKMSDSAHFITLTYNNENLPITEDGEATLKKRDIQLFNKRLRKAIQRCKIGKSYRYYFVGEYGPSTDRPHYHFIGFNIPSGTLGDIQAIWGLGNVLVGDVNPKSINYVTKYLMKDEGKTYDFKQKPFALMSKNPAIGLDYLKENFNFIKKNATEYVIHQGKKIAMPRYFKEKVHGKLTRLAIANKNIKQSDDAYQKDIHKLRHYESPELERIVRIENIRSKINKSINKKRSL